jgi:hypothetical protein
MGLGLSGVYRVISSSDHLIIGSSYHLVISTSGHLIIAGFDESAQRSHQMNRWADGPMEKSGLLLLNRKAEILHHRIGQEFLADFFGDFLGVFLAFGVHI